MSADEMRSEPGGLDAPPDAHLWRAQIVMVAIGLVVGLVVLGFFLG